MEGASASRGHRDSPLGNKEFIRRVINAIDRQTGNIMETPRRIQASVPKTDNMTGFQKRESRALVAEAASSEGSVGMGKVSQHKESEVRF